MPNYAYNSRDITINISEYFPPLALQMVSCDFTPPQRHSVQFYDKVTYFKTNSINMVKHVYNNNLTYQWLSVETRERL